MFAGLMWELSGWCHDLILTVTGWRVMERQFLDENGAVARCSYEWVRKYPPNEVLA